MSAVPLFWGIALFLLALTLGVLLWPLVRRARVEAPTEDAARLAVYRDQKRQLDEDLAAGVLGATDHAAGVDELARRLGVEIDADSALASQPPRERLGLVSALAVVAIIPAAAIVLYLVVGTPDALRPQSADTSRPSDREVIAMVETLAAKMKANPADPKGWRLLARSYAALGRYDESSAAYAQAVQRGGEDADVLADWAEAMALAHGRRVSGEPEKLAQRALALNPEHGKAVALLATAAFERRDFAGSITLWRRLQASLAPGSEDYAQTQAAIDEIERIRANVPPGSAASPSESSATGAGNAAPAVAASPDRSATGGTVAGTVELAPAIAARAAPGDTLYVFARAPGSRMPVAVLRAPAGSWPRSFELDDSMSMAGGTKLSAAPSVNLEARVSHSGNATPQPGDLVGTAVETRPGARDVRIVLDRVLP